MATQVVTKLRRGWQPQGSFKQAIVEGARFPDVAFHDPSFAEYVCDLKRRGYLVADNVPVEDFSTADTVLPGVHPLSEVLKAEAVQKPVTGTSHQRM